MKIIKKTFIFVLVLTFLLVIIVKEYYPKTNSYVLFSNSYKRPKYPVDCKLILEMDKNEIEKAKTIVRNLPSNMKIINDRNFIFDQFECLKLKTYFKINDCEQNFPLAISILVHENAEQVFRLLKAIYQSQNIYCIHIDKKSDKTFKKAVRSMVKCFDNVFLSTKTENIVYGGFSRLQADINCLKDLLSLNDLNKTHKNLIGKRFINWRYAYNLVGTEFPLRTNSEMIKIIKIYNGSNEIELVKIDSFLERIEYEWFEDYIFNNIFKTGKKKSQPPHGYKVFKGYSGYLISRDFAKYAIYDNKAKDFLKWTKNTYSPDEIFWSTLHFNTKFFSSHGLKYDSMIEKYDSLIKYTGWYGEKNDCNGYYRHGICVFSIEDLPELVNRPHFIANKFQLHYDPVAYQCIEEWYEERKMKNSALNMFFYCKFIQSRSTNANCAKINSDIDFKNIKLYSSIISVI